MTPEQQRTFDESIIEGRLIDAIGLYRQATGCDLAEAQNVVKARSAQLDHVPQPSVSSGNYAPQQMQAVQAEAAVRAFMPKVNLILAFVAVIAFVPILIAGFAIFGVARSFGGALGDHGGGTLGGLGTITTLMTSPNKLGASMLLHEPYYPRVVGDIENDAGFQGALGTPIAIDESAITCTTIKNGYTSRTANCALPVRGPNGFGSVRIAVVEQRVR